MPSGCDERRTSGSQGGKLCTDQAGTYRKPRQREPQPEHVEIPLVMESRDRPTDIATSDIELINDGLKCRPTTLHLMPSQGLEDV